MLDSWLLYGANGYTGKLIAEAVGTARAKPILAGRSAANIEPLAARLGCEARVFDLTDAVAVREGLRDVALVLNCAGPFSKTATPMMAACLDAGVHYLDITGEIDVIEYAAHLDSRAKQAGTVLMPAVGFDVVPSDCLARAVAESLPGATHLTLAFTSSGGFSRGTAKTMLESLPDGPRHRSAGRIVQARDIARTRRISFPSGLRQARAVPWGDVASAYYTTGIPNIATYVALDRADAWQMSILGVFAPLLRSKGILRWLQSQVDRRPPGPNDQALQDSRAEFWCEVRDDEGHQSVGTLQTPGGYALTILTALAVVDEVLADRIPPGFHTPAKPLGWQFIERVASTQVMMA
ncbi:MAG: saccharopine dehydrogenase NADP-binding domain-containing protein [Planctomycetes bacterium]|nr:saccharopine dehydrogenase NADP-binding domain-containing protein [Planctomycetota bacterium]